MRGGNWCDGEEDGEGGAEVHADVFYKGKGIRCWFQNDGRECKSNGSSSQVTPTILPIDENGGVSATGSAFGYRL